MTPDDYVVGHVRDALAHDGETDVHVAVVAGRLVLTGNVATEARRAAVAEVAAGACGDLVIVNELSVPPSAKPDRHEELA